MQTPYTVPEEITWNTRTDRSGGGSDKDWTQETSQKSAEFAGTTSLTPAILLIIQCTALRETRAAARMTDESTADSSIEVSACSSL